MASTEMIWLLIANASRARIFEWVKGQGGHLREVADFVHPQSRMKGSELSSDRAGHTQRTQGDSDIGGASLDHFRLGCQPHCRFSTAAYSARLSAAIDGSITGTPSWDSISL